MIVDYKKKSHYSNLVTNHETEENSAGQLLTTTNQAASEDQPRKMAQTSKTSQTFEAQEMVVP